MKVYALNNMPPIRIKFFHSKAKMRKELGKDGMYPELPDTDGFTHSFESDDGVVSLVYVRRTDTSSETMAILVHEAVHVAQAYWEFMNEDIPSSEFMAYTVQQISQWLIEEQRGERHGS